MKKITLIVLVSLIFNSVFSQKRPDFLIKYDSKWVDSVFNTLTLEQKIGQLLMPRGNTSGKGYDPEKLKKWVVDYQIGGLVFFAGQPTVQANIVNQLQSLSKVPMLIGMDMEWGMAMRLDSTVRFPYQLALGAMQGGEELIYRMGQEVGRHSKRMGIHINYAPVVDINNNPNNPVINFRSFGEDKLAVANKALAYMQGMQSENLIVTAKHFPGHGDTGVDSHYDLPVIAHDKKHLSDNELFPFKYLIDNGLSGIMTAHLSIPELDKTSNLASTFSTKIVNDLLRNELKFEGLTFTDAMDMQGAVKYFPNGEALVKAILAGNDILETFEEVDIAIAAIKKAIQTKALPIKVLDERVKKILKAKYFVGLNNYKPIELAGLVDDLNTIESDLLNRLFAEKTLVALKNNHHILPVSDLAASTAVLSIDEGTTTAFQNMAANYTELQNIKLDSKKDDSIAVQNKIKEFLTYKNKIVGLHLNNIRPGAQYGVSDFNKKIIKKLADSEGIILVVFGNPYSLGKYPEIHRFDGLIMANQLSKYTEEAAAMAVFGGIETNGRLPVFVYERYEFNQGLRIEANGRLAYGIPEMVGIDGRKLEARLDSVVNLGIKEKAYPGAVAEVAVKGRVIYKKAFGFHTYEQAEQNMKVQRAKPNFEKGNQSDVMDRPNNYSVKHQAIERDQTVDGLVKETDLYDLASVTKVSASGLAVLQMMSEKKFSLDATLGSYLPQFRGSDKENLIFRDLLTHKAGLRPFIGFWQKAIDSTASLKIVLMQKLSLESQFEKDYQKQTFFQKLLKKKPSYQINYALTLKNNPKIWEEVSPDNYQWKSGIFNKVKTSEYDWQVADSMFINSNYASEMMEEIKRSVLKPDQGYVYSDLHFMLYPQLVKNITNTNFEDYIGNTYRSIGAHSLVFNPLKKYTQNQIAPTELDTFFRKGMVHGFVHDEAASMLGGVSGHAGLFGSANDLTKLMHLYLKKGLMGGKRYFDADIMNQCTEYQYPYIGNRRAIAFDKLDFNKNISNGPQMASSKSYGHSGFTGTFVWVDPQYDMTYVFLSNRVYPTRENGKIGTLNIRTEFGNQIIKTIKSK